MIRVISLSVLFVLLPSVFCHAYAYEQLGTFKDGSEPEGFLGIKWGTNINELKNMEIINYTGTVPGLPVSEIRWYMRAPYFVTIRNVFLLNIYYGFCKDKFVAVEASIPDAKSYYTIQDIFGELYGQGAYNQIWTGSKTQISLGITSSGYALSVTSLEEIGEVRKEQSMEKLKDK